MELAKGLFFSGKWFEGKVEVLNILEETNELKVKLQFNVTDGDEDYWWFETWNLKHTISGIKTGDYFPINS